jgi:CubicO group peptidase (beta-lactamase class C family)
VGPLGVEADGSWSLDSRRSGLELLQAGLNGRAIDFAKLGALYLHRGAWRGRQLVPRGRVAESTRVDSGTDPSPTFQFPHHNLVLVRLGTDYHYDHWPDPLATLARRLRT